MADGSAEHSPAVPRDISGGGGPTDRRTSWSPAPTLSFTVAEASDTGPGQVRRALPVSVSVSFSAVHGRSDETEAVASRWVVEVGSSPCAGQRVVLIMP
jgi:hypothetical protein